MSDPTYADAERVRESLASHFVMWHDVEGRIGGEWRCACGLKFGFSDTAIDHQATIVAARVAEAVDRERAAWATKIETLANDADLRGQASLNRTFDGGWLPAIIRPADLRALLAAGDTEGTP